MGRRGGVWGWCCCCLVLPLPGCFASDSLGIGPSIAGCSTAPLMLLSLLLLTVCAPHYVRRLFQQRPVCSRQRTRTAQTATTRPSTHSTHPLHPSACPQSWASPRCWACTLRPTRTAPASCSATWIIASCPGSPARSACASAMTPLLRQRPWTLGRCATGGMRAGERAVGAGQAQRAQSLGCSPA